MSHPRTPPVTQDELIPEGLRAAEPITKRDLNPLAELVTWQGRYVLGPKLGDGGSGEVHEAHDLLLGRTVAVKALHASAQAPAEMLEQEARALAAVDHPAVVRVYAVYPHARPPFLVMERARGRSLSSILRDGRLPLTRALAILKQIAAGLDALHASGIVHGDVKPANVIVDAEGTAKLIDVGLALFLDRVRPGDIVGTPSYMSPERVLGVDTTSSHTSRSDIYSFGVMCFEMMTGRLPFPAGSTTDVLRAHALQRPPTPSYAAGISSEFDGPMASALAKSPEDRPSSCVALVAALELASTGSDVHGQRLRVVVADDDPDQRTLLVAILGAHLPGANIVICDSGRAVLEAIAAEQTPVAVLDLGMPEPSGMELVRQVRERSPETAIVIVTGEGSGLERAQARELGVRRFLVKPIEVDELVQAIREAVEPGAGGTSGEWGRLH